MRFGGNCWKHAKVFANWAKVVDFSYTYKECTNLTTIGNNTFTNCSNATTFECVFDECSNLTTVGDKTFANCSKTTTFERTFRGCGSLTTIGANTFIGCNNVENYKYTFGDCSNLTGNAIPLWLKVPGGEINGYRGIPDGEGCFYGCRLLNDYEQIPEYWTVSPEN